MLPIKVLKNVKEILLEGNKNLFESIRVALIIFATCYELPLLKGKSTLRYLLQIQ